MHSDPVHAETGACGLGLASGIWAWRKATLWMISHLQTGAPRIKICASLDQEPTTGLRLLPKYRLRGILRPGAQHYQSLQRHTTARPSNHTNTPDRITPHGQPTLEARGMMEGYQYCKPSFSLSDLRSPRQRPLMSPALHACANLLLSHESHGTRPGRCQCAPANSAS